MIALRFTLLLLIGLGCAHAPPPDAPAPVGWARHFATHDDVKIEYLVRGPDGATPIVLIPGMTGDAAVWSTKTELLAAIDAMGPRKVIAISLRGRGHSSTPATGWTPEAHHGDIAAVIAAERLGRYHLVGHSMGWAYALGFALGRPKGEIVSLVAGDYFPAVIEVTEDWAKIVESRAAPIAYDPRLARHILREQGARDYADALDRIDVPLLVILGRKSAEPRVEALYAKAPHAKVVWIDYGHDTFSSAEAIAAFREHMSAVSE